MSRGIALEHVCAEPWAIAPEHLEVVRAIAGRLDVSPEMVAARAGRPLDGARKVAMRGDVAVIPVRGTIMRYGNLMSDLCPNGATSLDVLSTDIQAALDNPAVRAVVLEIDSPGGQASGVGELASRIAASRGTKPITAYVSSMGCSAAYYLAAACDSVVASPSAILGSIGVIVSVDTRDRAGELTLRSSQSPNKAPSPATEQGRADLQDRIDAIADVFIADVARFRGITPEEVAEKYGAGGTKVGKAAVAAGLADSLGDLESCIRSACMPTERPSKQMNVSANASQPESSPETGDKPGVNMGLKEKLLAYLNSDAFASDEPAPTPVAAAPVASANPEAQELIRATLAGAFQAQAEEFLDARLETTVTPAEKPALAALFVSHALADATSPLALADGKPVRRLDQFKASLDARKPHRLTEEVLPSEPMSAAEVINKLGGTVLAPASQPAAEEKASPGLRAGAGLPATK